MLVVLPVAFFVVITCIAIHYRSLLFISQFPIKDFSRHRWWINVLIFGAIMTHIVEITIFSMTYFFLSHWPSLGRIEEASGAASTDFWYYSFVVFTSLGFGDLTPHGSIRMLTALETLTGLILIAWTASFFIVQMQNWSRDVEENQPSTQS